MKHIFTLGKWLEQVPDNELKRLILLNNNVKYKEIVTNELSDLCSLIQCAEGVTSNEDMHTKINRLMILITSEFLHRRGIVEINRSKVCLTNIATNSITSTRYFI